MHRKNKNKHKIIIIIATILIVGIATGCTTTKYRDEAIIKSLKLQNDTIDAVVNSNTENKMVTNTEGKATSKIQENSALKALIAIKDSNEVLISKLKPKAKKECHCGKNERACDRSSKQH